jgi:Flp pilus assembly protein TadG
MIVRRLKCQENERHGAALVEFALVIPIFFVLFFGMVDIARGFMAKALLDNAARVGCRTGILQGKTNSDVNAAITAAFTGQGITGTTVTITVNGSAVDVSTAVTGDIVKVVVSVPVANVTWLPGSRYLTGSISGTYSLPRG